MAFAIAWADLRARFAAAELSWNGHTVPVAYPNTTFAAPAGNRPWMRVDVSGGAGRPIELGGETWQDEGQALIDVLVPVGTGVDATVALMDSLKGMFRGPPCDTITYVRVAADPGGAGDDDGQYFITSMRADWKLTTRINRS